MGTSWGAAIDYLIAGLTPVLQAVDPLVLVYDNGAIKTADKAVYIGAGEPGTADNGDWAGEYAWLGNMEIQESYTIPGFVDVSQPGPSQKTARDAAIALFDPVVTFVRQNPQFGTLLPKGYASVGGMTPRQTDDDDDAANGAVRCTIAFHINVKNVYRP